MIIFFISLSWGTIVDHFPLFLSTLFLSLSPPLRVTYRLMQKGETASYRGRDKNILASSSNTMTPAMMNTIRTHTDRYMHTHSSTHTFTCPVYLFNHFFYVWLFLNTCLNPRTWRTVWKMDYKRFHFQLKERRVTTVFPTAQTQDTRLSTCMFVCFDRARPCRRDYWNQFHAFSSPSFPCTPRTVVCASVCVDMEGVWLGCVHRLDTTSPQASESCLNEHFSLALKIISTFTLTLSLFICLSLPPTYFHFNIRLLPIHFKLIRNIKVGCR